MDREEQQNKPALDACWMDIQGRKSWYGLLDPFDRTLKYEILRYGDFADLCSSAISNHKMLAERLLFESDYLKKCGYEITKHIYSNVLSATSYTGIEHAWTYPWFGFIAVCTDEEEIRRLGRRDIVVAFRGTSGHREWIQNLKDVAVPWQGLPGTNSNCDVRIFKGFLGYYTDTGEPAYESSTGDIIKSEITRLLEMYHSERGREISITCTGHSLGGALATMTAYHIKRLHPSVSVTAFTFASPRVGNKAFADHMKEIGVKVLRVVVKGDWVPKLPGFISNENSWKGMEMFGMAKLMKNWSYYHVGTKISLDPDNSGDSSLLKHNLHGIKTHLYLIDGYQGSKWHFKSSARGKKYIVKRTTRK